MKYKIWNKYPAFNSEEVDFFVNDYLLAVKNMTFMEERKERGKIFITFETNKVTREFVYIVFYKKNQIP